jgi:hypothetical protein
MIKETYKYDLILDLFVRTADENYIAARWCAANGLYTDFLWLAVHALEKYLKAVLLMNGRSSKAYGHDITRLYAEVKTLAATLLPDRNPRPDHITPGPWHEVSTEFILHLWRNGNADNRYLIYGYASGTHDVSRLDQMVFAVRRLICPLDEFVVALGGTILGRTHRQLLERNPGYYLRTAMPLDDLIRGKGTPEARSAGLNQNFAFAPNLGHPAVGRRIVARNPVLIRRILDPLASGEYVQAIEAIKLATWLLENVQLPKGKQGSDGVHEEIESAIKAAKARHCIP